MRIVEGEHVDLISPFPTSELNRAVQWFFQYSSYTGDDASPKTPEAIKDTLEEVLATQLTYGIVDKNNISQYDHEAPMVGMISFAPQSLWNGYLHIATCRKAWGRKNGIGLADEALKATIEDIWQQFPAMLRLSALMTSKNYPARRLAERCGLKIDGVLEQFFMINGKPMDAVHLGILRVRESTEDDAIDRTGGITP